jgi:hypothetical protein
MNQGSYRAWRRFEKTNRKTASIIRAGPPPYSFSLWVNSNRMWRGQKTVCGQETVALSFQGDIAACLDPPIPTSGASNWEALYSASQFIVGRFVGTPEAGGEAPQGSQWQGATISLPGRIHSVSWGASLLWRCTTPVRETL